MGYLINSPLLFSQIETCRDSDYLQLLDIAPANAHLLEYFQGIHCKLYLPGCTPALFEMSSTGWDTLNGCETFLQQQLGFKQGDKARLDLILLWDLPNYLPPDLLTDLIQYLLPFSHRQTRIHTYIYTRETMPQHPAHFCFEPQNKIRMQQAPEPRCTCPMYYKEMLQRLMVPFVIERGILLSNGMQEYLLRRV